MKSFLRDGLALALVVGFAIGAIITAGWSILTCRKTLRSLADEMNKEGLK